MKHVIALVAILAMGVAASFALAAPPSGKGPNTSTSGSTSTSPGKSGDKSKCKPVNLKGTVSAGTIALLVKKASGPAGKQLLNTTANLTVSGNVSVQAWACSTAGSTAAPQLKLRQLHVGGSPHPATTTTP
jgi:hypothetical protein